MNTNPFKFGTIVSEAYFTDREVETIKIKSFLESKNHLIITGSRRFGKTSLIKNIVKDIKRPTIYLDLQMCTDMNDMAAILLKKVYQHYPLQKLKSQLQSFRIIPTITVNPISGSTEVSFSGISDSFTPLEDVLNLIDTLGEKDKRIILILDEFQEIYRIDKSLERTLRAVMQQHQNVNYIFLSSKESMIKDIFEKKKSPFYHFGALMQLEKIHEKDFLSFLVKNLKSICKNPGKLSETILDITLCHPHYTQQLAFTVWETLKNSPGEADPLNKSIEEIIQNHDNDYERLWNTLNSIDRKVLIGLSLKNKILPLSTEFVTTFHTGSTSTTFSGLQRLTMEGMLIKEKNTYILDDPFFCRWIIKRRGNG